MPILATALGAFFGFLWQVKNDRFKDKKHILMILMAHRGVGAREHDFVKALNMIDIVFHKNKEVRILAHEFFKNTVPPLFETGNHSKILLKLIFAMTQDIGYTSLQESDILDYYYPEATDRLYSSYTDKSLKENNSQPT